MKSTKLRSSFFVAGRKAGIALGSLLVFVVGIALFDWNWLRGPLISHLHEKSGREVRIGDLHVSGLLTLAPTVRLRDVYIQNAAWASGQQPMAVAREVSFAFSLDSLWQRRPIISRLVLIDADIDMERRADGSRNWRLTNPEYRGPGRVQVRTLQAERTKIRFVNGENDLEIVAQATPAEPAVRGPGEGDTLSSRLDFAGKYAGVPFVAAGLAGSTLSFRDSGQSFPVRGHFDAGKTRIDMDGTFADIFNSGPLDAQARFAGPTLSRLYPFFKFQPPVSRPYLLEARIIRAGDKYTFEKLHGKIGDTDIAGDVTYDRDPGRPLLKASLRSESADLTDITSLAGMDNHAGKSIAEVEPKKASINPAPASPTVPAEHPRAADVHLTLELKKLRTPAMPLLESLRFAADRVEGALQITAIDLGVAGGHVTGSLAYDGQAAHASLDARNIRLERLVPVSSPSAAPTVGAMRSQLRLTGHGDSIAAALAGGSGSLVALVEGGRISNLLDAKLGLNAGKALGLKIRGDRDIALNCGAAAFDIRKGVGKSQFVLLETEQTHIDGAGTIDLRSRKIDLLLTPQPKNPGLFTLNSSIRVEGTFGNVSYKVTEREQLQRGGIAATPAAVAALFRPLLDAGQPNGQCAAMFGTPSAAANAVIVKE